ncbi:MAG: hypothetical protein Unbinned4585contig1001_47 [Prokaryotic dsDNA virus sp.]|nr:MAG: hypothetical protein Unbinned4585contig1001_47 [Prokaryotic dsDNA virus sp.]|tara:strand:+ start:8939 stop:9232 length:294 start_codon:yes stop_codon:yes gene_type:complete
MKKTKEDILWEYISEKDIKEIEERFEELDNETEYRHIWDMHTFQCVENEVYMGGVYFIDGIKKDITLVFQTSQFLEWLNGNTEYMKEQLIKYINQIN